MTESTLNLSKILIKDSKFNGLRIEGFFQLNLGEIFVTGTKGTGMKITLKKLMDDNQRGKYLNYDIMENIHVENTKTLYFNFKNHLYLKNISFLNTSKVEMRFQENNIEFSKCLFNNSDLYLVPENISNHHGNVTIRESFFINVKRMTITSRSLRYISNQINHLKVFLF